MKIHVLDGGPRKNENTARMCERFAAGAQSAGAEVEVIRLYDLTYRGCYSCFACKLKGGKSYGRCGWPDEIKEVLERVSLGDGVVFASPIYFGDVTAETRGFMERLFFPFVVYDKNFSRIAPKKLEAAVIYTMNVTEEMFQSEYLGSGPLGFFERWITMVYGEPERITAFDTLQFHDYSRYEGDLWDEAAKRRQHETQFPKDLENAYEAGIRMARRLANRG